MEMSPIYVVIESNIKHFTKNLISHLNDTLRGNHINDRYTQNLKINYT